MIVILIAFVISLVLTPAKYRKVTNPLFMFELLWLLIMFLADIHLIGLYDYSTITLVIIIVGVLSFAIGYFLILRNKQKNVDIQKKIKFEINYKVLYVVCIICILYFMPLFFKSIGLLISGNTLEDIRSLVQDSQSELHYNGKLNNLIYNFVVLPGAVAIEVLAVSDFWIGKRDKKLFIANIIIIALRIISDAGRTPLFNFVIYMLIGYMVAPKSNNSIKSIKKYGIIGGIFLVITSILRSSSSIFRHMYFYFAMPPVLLSQWVDKVKDEKIITYGVTSFNGIFFTIVYFIKNICGLDYPGLIVKSYDLIARTDSEWKLIAQGGVKANAYVSSFLFMYADGRILGVIIGMILYGCLVAFIYKNIKNECNIKNMSYYLIIYQGLFFSFIRFPFCKPYYVLGMIIIAILIRKKTKVEEREEEVPLFKIHDNTIIYVVCPAYNKTGGTELAHQLVFELNKQGANAIITYYGENEEKINPAFKKYVNKYEELKNIKDCEENIIILPEIVQELEKKYNNIQKAVWWMSVDNFVKRNGFINAIKFYGVLKSIKYALNGKISLMEKNINGNIIHFYQSEYAKQFLLSNNVTKVYRLSDYINQEYLNDNTSVAERKDSVLYNPKKGLEFTQKIIEKSKKLNWIPIQNMTTEEVHQLLLSSKVYIDFGNHPGKDRFPREAAISGCCVITGKRGAAAYYNDIPIDDEFKFDDSIKNVDAIISKIEECLKDYDTQNLKFEKYRDYIKREHEIFEKDVSQIIMSNN